jgi:hypothetical protein
MIQQSHSGDTPKEMLFRLLQRLLHTHVYFSAIKISQLWKQTRCPTTYKGIKKLLYLYTIEFYLAMKKNKILSFTSKWMELENIILSKVSQIQKTKNLISPSYADFRLRANAAMLFDLGHMLRGEDIREVWW